MPDLVRFRTPEALFVSGDSRHVDEHDRPHAPDDRLLTVGYARLSACSAIWCSYWATRSAVTKTTG